MLGLDFTGGTQIEVGYPQPADLSVIRAQLTESGFENPTVIYFGSESDVLIRLQGEPAAGLSDEVFAALKALEGTTIRHRKVRRGAPYGDGISLCRPCYLARWRR